MWQQLLIALIVAIAAAYVTWSFLSLRRRQWLLDVLARRGLFTARAARHRQKLALPGCGNCSGAAAHKPLRR